MALVKTTGRAGDDTFPLVCSNVGPGGAYFSSRVAITPGARMLVSLRAPGHNAPVVDMVSEIVWSVPHGGTQPAGVAVRWLRAESATGAEPLRALLRGLLRMSDLGDLDRATSRTVAFDFMQFHEEKAVKAASSTRAMAATMRPMVVPRMEPVLGPATAPPSPVPVITVDEARTDRVVPESTLFERRAAARRGSGLRTFPPMAPISGPYDALPDAGQRRATGPTPTVPPRTLTPQPLPVVPARPTPSTVLAAPVNPRISQPIAAASPPPRLRPPSDPIVIPPVPTTVAAPQPIVVPTSNSLTFSPLTPPPQPVRPSEPLAFVNKPAERVMPLPPQTQTTPIPHLVTPPAPRVTETVVKRGTRSSPPDLSTASQVSSSMGGFAMPRVVPPTDNYHGSWPMGVPRVLAERYGDLLLLGQGGHGVVFRARDLLLDRFVVLKFLAGTGMAPEQARRYFLREFKVAADLLHPNIVRLYDIGSADGTLYYTMEYVPGHPLGHYLGKQQRLDDMAFVNSVFAQLAAALDHAHRHGVLHRDVKPNNVLVADDGSVRLFDFGLARLLAEGTMDQSMVVGTPFYMAPEMQRTAPIDSRADQYALGVVLYRMLTGRVPFADGNVFLAHAIAPVPDPRVFHAELPAAVSPILMRMLAKQPEDRYPDCASAAAALAPILVPTKVQK